MTNRVLIVDDEESVADLLGELFRVLHFEPTVSYNPRHAIELIAEERFDVVVSDFRMPGMNGQAFYNAAVKACPELARRMIFLTGDMLSEETQMFMRAAEVPFLTKPFALSQVQALVNSLIEEPVLAD